MTVMMGRLALAMLSFVFEAYDQRSAFPSLKWDPSFDELHRLAAAAAGSGFNLVNWCENLHRRMRQRHLAKDGSVQLRRRGGVREGCTGGPGVFRRAYRLPIENWRQQRRSEDPIQRRLDTEYRGITYDMAHEEYVDDVSSLSQI